MRLYQGTNTYRNSFTFYSQICTIVSGRNNNKHGVMITYRRVGSLLWFTPKCSTHNGRICKENVLFIYSLEYPIGSYSIFSPPSKLLGPRFLPVIIAENISIANPDPVGSGLFGSPGSGKKNGFGSFIHKKTPVIYYFLVI